MSEEGLQIAEKRREVKGKGEKERYTHLIAEFQRIARRDKKAFLSDQCKEIEENNRMGKTRGLTKKIRGTKGTLGFPGGSEVKSFCFKFGRPGFNPWVGKIPRRRKWQPTPVFLPEESHGQRSLVDPSPWGRKELDTTEPLHYHYH